MSQVLLFDGSCAFCNKSVLFILKRCKNDQLMVASNDSISGKAIIQDHSITANPEDTLIFLDNDKVRIKSSAVLHICKSLKGFYPLLMAFIIVPPFIRDFFYDMVAKRRKKLIKSDQCSFEMASTFKSRVLE